MIDSNDQRTGTVCVQADEAPPSFAAAKRRQTIKKTFTVMIELEIFNYCYYFIVITIIILLRFITRPRPDQILKSPAFFLSRDTFVFSLQDRCIFGSRQTRLHRQPCLGAGCGREVGVGVGVGQVSYEAGPPSPRLRGSQSRQTL
jgi:hypothetical protein